MALTFRWVAAFGFFAVIFAASVASQIATERFHPVIYWVTIVATTTVGTTLADFADRSLGIGYAGGVTLLVILLATSLFAWHRVMGTIAVDTVNSPRAEIFCWVRSISTDVIGQLQLSDQGLTSIGPLVGAPAHMVQYPVDLPVLEFVGFGFPQAIEISFSTWAGGDALGTEVNTASADFSRLGFQFPTDSPVFDLPAGLTVNVPSLGIVDNHWVAPIAGAAPVARTDRLSLAALRNPVHGSARFALTLPADGAARVEVFDLGGRRVATPLDGWQASGRRELAWDAAASGAAGGVYFARVTSGREQSTARIVVVR